MRIFSATLILGWLGLLLWMVYQWLFPAQLPAVATYEQEGVITTPLSVEPVDTLVADQQHYDNLVERPLFYPSRRPPAPEPESSPESEPTPLPAADEALTLVGIIIMPEGMRALIREDESRRVSRLQLGDSIARWRLADISPEQVRLTRADRQRVLSLVRNSRQPTLERTPGFEAISEESLDDDSLSPSANGIDDEQKPAS